MVNIVQVPSPNYRAGNWKKEGFILHHMAGYLPGTDAEFRKPDNIATNYGVGSRDGHGNGLEIHQYVQDHNRAYGSYNNDGDCRAISIEIENSAGLGKPTPAVHELVAQLVAYKAQEHGMDLPLTLGDFPDHRYYLKAIPGLGNGFNVTTHRSMALKNCPNEVDVKWIVARANQIVGHGSAPAHTPTSVPAASPAPAHVTGWDFRLPDKAMQKRIQRALKARGRYKGLVDGKWGKLTIAAIQLTLRNVGYKGGLDGSPGPATCYYVQVYAARFGGYKGGADKHLGPYSWLGFALGLESP